MSHEIPEATKGSAAARAKLVVTLSLLATLGTAGCRTVRVYERGHLAHPTMAAESAQGPSEEHMRSVHEGATGGSSAAGGGCGCN